MNLLTAIRREEVQVEKQLRSLQHRLEGLRSAKKALANPTVPISGQSSRRALSAEARARISAAQKKRWAKVRAHMKKQAA